VDVAVLTGDEATASLLQHAFESAGFRAPAIRNGLAGARLRIGSKSSLRPQVLTVDPAWTDLRLLRQFAAQGGAPAGAGYSDLLAFGRPGTVAGLELGAQDRVAKPFEVPVLVECVTRMLQP